MRHDDEPGGGAGPVGGMYVDFTAKRADGSAVRVLLVDTLADGVTPTARDRSAAARIRAARPHDELRLVPKAQSMAAHASGPGAVASRTLAWARGMAAGISGRWR